MPADVCGPFTLEQLDLFGGNLDALPFSLDDAIWTLTTTCVLYADGAVTSAGTVNTGTSVTSDVQGLIVASGNVAALVARIQEVTGAIDAAGTFTSDAVRIRVVDGVISAQGLMSGDANATFGPTDAITASGSLTALAGYVVDAAAGISSNAQFICTVYKMGDEWVLVPDQPNTWSDIAVQSNTWTQQSSGSNTWVQIG